MSPEPGLTGAVSVALGVEIAAAEPVPGGSINDAWRMRTAAGSAIFVKSRSGAPAAEFEAEAAGLRWLTEPDAIGIPEVLGVGADPPWLALEWIEPGSLGKTGAEELGAGLAQLHRAGGPAHGALPPGSPDAVLRIGSVELPAAGGESWAEVYAQERLLPLVAMARDRGALNAGDAAAVEAVAERIADLAGPAEPPARLHGDLWSGNVHAGADGLPWLIDPAAHGGHREIDLAMLALFGSPSPRTLAAYDEAFPLADGHEDRVALWQILPLLVHAVLFGGHYGASAGRAATASL